MSEPLDHLCQGAGIALSYIDAWGEARAVPPATRRRLLAAVGLAAETDTEIAASLLKLERLQHGRLLPPVLVMRESEGVPRFTMTVPAATPARAVVEWSVTLESGESRRGTAPLRSLAALDATDSSYRRYALELPPRPPLGYHSVEARIRGVAGSEASMALVMVPLRCYQPRAFEHDGRRWGVTAQLYGLRSARNWGMGDFTDLTALVRGLARLGAAIVGVNPLHALFPERPRHASPYSPSSRLFLNILYLDLEAMEDFRLSEPARRLVASSAFQERLRGLRASDQVDYDGVAACKLQVLELLHRAFRERCLGNPEDQRTQSFRDYQSRRGERLRHFALFEALSEHFPAAAGWRGWPPEFQDPRSAAVVDFAASHLERVEFHEYLQWQAESQLARATEIARRLGMSIGLYNDLAVGVDGGGADAWESQELLAWDAHVGAPPDAWNLGGQDWGLRSFNPLALREQGYAPFAELLRANMRHGAALRIDHILGLVRLFWIPPGSKATEGSYIAFPWRDLLGIVALESQRNRCLVVGEDLGTVPEGLREALDAAGILSYRLFYFEKNAAGDFRPVAEFPQNALAALGTHDLPTIAGFWRDADIALRDRLALWPTPGHREEARAGRERDRTAIRRLLGTAASSAEPIEPDRVSEAIYGYLADAPSRLLTVQFEDLIGQIEQVNLPGTADEHPNWRQRLALPLESLLGDARLRRVAERLNRARADRPHYLALPAGDKGDKAPPRIPRATYRIQFHRDFTFDDACRILPYLRALGVSHLYASSWLKARAGSQHGYDITDHNAFNPELGGEAAFENFAAVLGDSGLGQILDFVPNHMGIGKADNEWWLDVLEWGKASPYAAYFDIDWRPENAALRDKLWLPLLGEHYGQALEAGHLLPRFDAPSGHFSVWYFEHRFPVAPRDYRDFLLRAQEKAADKPEAASVSERLGALAGEFATLGDDGGRDARERARRMKLRLAELALADFAAAELLSEAAAALAGEVGKPESFVALHRLLDRQHYRLAYWGVAGDEINYRRFFNINELAGIRMENAELFAAAHRLTARLIAERKLHGLRIDHVDGLFDPEEYCARLQDLAQRAAPSAENFYVTVEKILARHERLRESWPVCGTTGYDFLAQVNGLLVDGRHEAALTRIYHRFIGREIDYDELAYEARHLAMDTLLGSELRVLALDLNRISEANWNSRDYTLEGLRLALKEVIACFPVYRTYVSAKAVAEEDRRDIVWAVSQARKRWKGHGGDILNFIEGALTTDLVQGEHAGYRRAEIVRFAMKFQQYTGPVAAKGIEDTAFYRFHRLASLCEVGSDPRQFGVSVAAFHHMMQDRVRQWPHAMLATATHDTKHGEDVRARLDVLSEMPQEWSRRVSRWAGLNRRKKREIDGRPAPGRNDEYLLYQTLVAAWPTVFTEIDGAPAAMKDFAARMKAQMRKAVREAKERSSWINPNEDYEGALDHFIDGLLDPRGGRLFLADFRAFQARVARLGMLGGLVQTALKLSCPGVPDIYQGSELWDLSLVDPDNRRPVDFAHRARLLGELTAIVRSPWLSQSVDELRKNWRDGRIKLYVIMRILSLRREFPLLFEAGNYAPLETAGPRADHILAFTRGHEGRSIIVAVGRLFAPLVAGEEGLPSAEAWAGTALRLPADGRRGFHDFLSGRDIPVEGEAMAAATLFETLPVALLLPQT